MGQSNSRSPAHWLTGGSGSKARKRDASGGLIAATLSGGEAGAQQRARLALLPLVRTITPQSWRHGEVEEEIHRRACDLYVPRMPIASRSLCARKPAVSGLLETPESAEAACVGGKNCCINQQWAFQRRAILGSYLPHVALAGAAGEDVRAGQRQSQGQCN